MVEFDVINRLDEISAPTLIIHGDEDRMLSLILAELLYQKIRNSILRVIEGAGHCPHLEKPKEFNKIIIAFLNELDKVSVFKSKLVLAQYSGNI